MHDITPKIPEGKKVIDAYGGGGFTVNEEKIKSSILILPDEVVEFNAENLEQIDSSNFLTHIEANISAIELILVGGGLATDFLDTNIEKFLRKNSVSVEYMDTGAACRTYNILLSEERKVAALLIKV